AGGCLRGVDVVAWPEDIRTVDTLTIPEPSKEGSVTFPSRKSQPGVAAVEVDTALTVEKNQQESVFHLRVGRTRATTVVRVADRLLVEVDKQSRLVGLWFLDVPPFPNVEATACAWTSGSSATLPSCSPAKIRSWPLSERVTTRSSCRRSRSPRTRGSCCTFCCAPCRPSACSKSARSRATRECGSRVPCRPTDGSPRLR